MPRPNYERVKRRRRVRLSPPKRIRIFERCFVIQQYPDAWRGWFEANPSDAFVETSRELVIAAAKDSFESRCVGDEEDSRS